MTVDYKNQRKKIPAWNYRVLPPVQWQLKTWSWKRWSSDFKVYSLSLTYVFKEWINTNKEQQKKQNKKTVNSQTREKVYPHVITYNMGFAVKRGNRSFWCCFFQPLKMLIRLLQFGEKGPDGVSPGKDKAKVAEVPYLSFAECSGEQGICQAFPLSRAHRWTVEMSQVLQEPPWTQATSLIWWSEPWCRIFNINSERRADARCWVLDDFIF